MIGRIHFKNKWNLCFKNVKSHLLESWVMRAPQVISENHCHTGNNNKTKEQKTLRVSQWTKFILINESNDTVQGY